jgi:D-psicose/D-tagatose/L-ribulose 3-epimerase
MLTTLQIHAKVLIAEKSSQGTTVPAFSPIVPETQQGEPSVKVGFNLLVVGGLITAEHGPLFEELKALGYHGVELPMFEGTPEHYRALGRVLRETGLEATTCAIMTEAENPISPEPLIRAEAGKRLRWAIDCSQALGAGMMMGPFHSPLGVFSGHGPSEAELDHLAAVMREGAIYGAKAGVNLSLEPLNRFECYVLNTMAQAAALARRVDHPNFGTTFDTFHANIEERDPIAAFTAHAAGINHIHVSENDRGIPGRGHVPFGPIIRAVKAAGYDGWLTVEAFGRSVPALSAATRVWRDLFPDLATLFAESIALIRREWAAA